MYVYILRSLLSVFPPACLSPHLLYILSPPSSSLLPLSGSPLDVGLTSERAQCVDWTEGELYQLAIRRIHRRIQTSQSYWPPCTGQPQCVGHTLVTSQLVRKVCVCLCVQCVGRGISVARKVTACSSSVFWDGCKSGATFFALKEILVSVYRLVILQI